MHRVVPLLLWTSLVLVASCKDDKTQQAADAVSSDKADAGMAAKARKVDKGLAEAVEKVSQSKGSAPSSRDGGPPESGVFEPGQANLELDPGQGVKVTVGSTGKAPRVQLGGRPKPGSKRRASLMLSLRLGQGQRLPPLNLDLTLAAHTSKADPNKVTTEGKGGPGVDVTAKVEKVGIAARGMRLPEQLEQEVGKLKGSTVTFHVGEDGQASRFVSEVAEAAGPSWQLAVKSLSTALSLSLIPYPEEPIGVGGYFLAVSRSELAGVAVLVYRMVKVVSINEGRATLDVSGREYAVDREVSSPDLVQGQTLQLEQFSAQGSGKAEIASGQFYPVSSESSLTLNALLELPDPESAQSPANKMPGLQGQRVGLQAKIGFSFKVDGVDQVKASQEPAQAE